MTIQLITLGGLRAERDGAELDRLPGQRARAALLVYLAVERHATREAIAALFWPESTEDNARHALRQSLYHLRGELGEGWLEQRALDLRATDDLAVDLRAFEEAAEQGDYERAARLYRGPFLAGVHLLDLLGWERWVDERRAACAQRFRRLCRDWCEQRRAAGDIDGAIDAARRWVTPDPLDDDAQHRLIALLAESGDRTAALRQFEAYEALLRAEELPLREETRELAERLRADLVPRPVLELPPRAGQPRARDSDHAHVTPAVASRGERHRHSRLLPFAAIVLLLIVLPAVALRAPWRAQDAASADVLAVLPFAVHGGADLDYLRSGMVSLLGTSLDGAVVRTVDPRAVLALAPATNGDDGRVDRAQRLAQRLGAGWFVLGDVVRAGDRLRVEAALYRAGRGNAPVSSAASSGMPDSLFAIVDALSAQLLAELGGGSGGGMTRTAAATTESLTAFKAYLEGEAELRAGRFERAIDAFVRAIDHDSTFAVAHYRLALARDWAAVGEEAAAAGAAARFATRLAPRERALVDALHAYHSGDMRDAERRYRAILARYPDELEAWSQLGEVLFHYGPPHGRPASESETAWRTVLSYEPANLWAMVHLGRIAAASGRTATLDSLLAPYAPREIAGDRRLVQLALYRAVGKRDTAGVRTLSAMARTWEDAALYQIAAYLVAFTHDPAMALVAIDELAKDRREPDLLEEMQWLRALSRAANGRLTEARRLLAELRRGGAAADERWAVAEWWIATLPVPSPDDALHQLLARAQAAGASAAAGTRRGARVIEAQPIWRALPDSIVSSPELAPERREALRQHTIGVLALRLNDLVLAHAAAARLDDLARGSQRAFVRDLARALRARLTWREQGPDAALRIVEELEPPEGAVGAFNIVPFLSRPQARYLRGELLVALGRDEEAIAWFASLGQQSVPESAYRAPAHLRQAEIHDRLGDRAAAAEHYARVVALWQDADPAVQPTVEMARTRLAELTGRR